MERDLLCEALGGVANISTHTLTWSVTDVSKSSLHHLDISTHTLTWSVTQQMWGDLKTETDFNSHAHVERDSFITGNICSPTDFNSHAHVERDHPYYTTY